MRGKDCRAARLCGGPGITPAHAGKRLSPLYPIPPGWDHPRTCGEKTDVTSSVVFRSGSPPHMRGKANALGLRFLFVGITPAHAGKRPGRCKQPSWSGDHPRTCGEKSPPSRKEYCKKGSPPHMRGKGGESRRGQHSPGITPAHAGKRSAAPFRARCAGDHPRTCGEKFLTKNPARYIEGSPPHMRGKVKRKP